jgi:hypothetical protein
VISTSSPLTTTSNVKHSKILNFPCAKFISGFHKYQCSRFENRNLLLSKVPIDCCTSLHQQRQHFKVKEKKRKPLTCLKIYLQQTTVFQNRKYWRFLHTLRQLRHAVHNNNQNFNFHVPKVAYSGCAIVY